jgi:hypothetical protein
MRNPSDILNEVIPLIKSDEKNLIYFFGNAKDPNWLEPLIAEGLFDPKTIPLPVKTENGFINH